MVEWQEQVEEPIDHRARMDCQEKSHRREEKLSRLEHVGGVESDDDDDLRTITESAERAYNVRRATSKTLHRGFSTIRL